MGPTLFGGRWWREKWQDLVNSVLYKRRDRCRVNVLFSFLSSISFRHPNWTRGSPRHALNEFSSFCDRVVTTEMMTKTTMGAAFYVSIFCMHSFECMKYCFIYAVYCLCVLQLPSSRTSLCPFPRIPVVHFSRRFITQSNDSMCS